MIEYTDICVSVYYVVYCYKCYLLFMTPVRSVLFVIEMGLSGMCAPPVLRAMLTLTEKQHRDSLLTDYDPELGQANLTEAFLIEQLDRYVSGVHNTSVERIADAAGGSMVIEEMVATGQNLGPLVSLPTDMKSLTGGFRAYELAKLQNIYTISGN